MARTDRVSVDSRHHSWILAARGQVEDSEARGASFPRRGGRAGQTLPADFLPGYELHGEIHRGGQGIVFRATQKSTGRTVAIKMLREAAFAGPTERSRFEREVQVLAALKHPNIVTIHDSGNAAGHLYFVMDFIAGRPLDAYVAGEKPPVRDVLRLFATICDAVNAAHVLGIVHRDLKPGNIRVGADGAPYVLDFGLARLADGATTLGETDSPTPMTVTGQFVGSLPWATPEQADGNAAAVDFRSDVYSLGVILYQVLTGRFPYPVSGRMRHVLESIAQTPPANPRSVARTIDDEVATIILTCLAKEPARRYQSAGDLAADIRRYLAGEPIAAKRDSTWYVLRKTAARHRRPIAAAGVVMLLLIAATTVCWALMLRARQSEHDARENLRGSLLAQARARRDNLAQGRRIESLSALAQAASIWPGVDLRGEVISALALPDILTRFRPMPPDGFVVATSPDGSFGAVQHGDGSVSVVAFVDGSVVARIPPVRETNVEFVTFRCDRRRLCRLFDRVGAPRRLEVWRIPQADLLLAVSDVPDRASFDISPDDRTLAVGRTDRAIHFYDLESGAETRRIELDRDPSYLRFDPTGRRLLRFHARDAEASILDLDTGISSRILDGQLVSFSVAWRSDGGLIAAAYDDSARLWDVDRHKVVAVLAGHDSTIVHLAFSQNGRLLISEDWGGVAFLWDLVTLKPLLRLNVQRACFSTDDRFIHGFAIGDARSVGASGELTFGETYALVASDVACAAARTQSGAIDPSGRIAVAAVIDKETGADGIQFYDVRGRRPMGRIACKGVREVAFAASSGTLFSSNESRVVRWPVRIDGITVHVGPPEVLGDDLIGHFGVSADGRRIAYSDRSGSRFKIIDMGDPPARRSFASMPRGGIVSVSPDGRWAAVSAWQSAGCEIWDMDAGVIVARLPVGANARTTFTADGRQLIIQQSGTGMIVETGRWNEIRNFNLPLNTNPACTSRDGRMLACTDSRGTIHLCELARPEALAVFSPPDPNGAIGSALSADGSTLAVFSLRGGTLQLWDLRQIRAALAAMRLDWDHPPLSAASPGDAPPLRLEVDGCSLVPARRREEAAAR